MSHAMFHFLAKTVCNITTSPLASRPAFIQNSLISVSLRYISTSSNQLSFTVSYLIDSLGFTPESALSASKHVSFETRTKPDTVLEFFTKQGFSKIQILDLVRRRPKVLVSNPEKTLLPKVLFLHSQGITPPEIARMLSGNPLIFRRSLENHIIPNFDLITSLLGTKEKTVFALKRFLSLLNSDIETSVLPNINILEEHGVPKSNITMILQYQPRAFLLKPHRFREVVEQVKEMGFDPLRGKFVIAVFALRTLSKLTWERKINVFKKWGWSEEDMLLAFRRHPWCILTSEDKINGMMDFFVNIMGWDPLQFVKRPALLSLSLEKRIIPRGLVARSLLSKGLLKKGFSIGSLFECREKLFLQKFVEAHKDVSTELLKLYNEKQRLAQCKKTSSAATTATILGSGNIL